ncbi:hypothetical protein DTO012A8_10030 [Penicillium roqueforti]|nr:hypothetical protein DTO012A8_10030 [Penicillium roqueforti]
MYSGYWTANVVDTDKIIEEFFEICYQAGPEKCSFAAGNTVEILKSQSRWMADIWASFPVPCWGWKTRPKWRYEGPISGSPAHPILWIGNTLDPATPLRNAYKMAAKFSGSVVLEQDSAGHCTYSPGSTCIAKNVRRYFHTGILPGIGNRCGPDKRPFGIA